MLLSLTVKNYALINYVHIQLDTGLNIITGETGAGKSILLGALGLILGKRADSSIVQNKDEKCYVEGIFTYNNANIDQLLLEQDIENNDGELIIRRELSPQGKSRAFINDTPTTLDILQSLTSMLIDVHAQHETQSITDRDFFIPLIDATALHTDEVKRYQDLFFTYKKNLNTLQQLVKNKEKIQQELDFLHFQYQELDIALQNTENYGALEEELQRLEYATTIQEWIAQVRQLLYDGENNFYDLNNQLIKIITQINAFTKNYDTIIQLLEQLYIEIKPLQRQLQHDEIALQSNPERVQELQDKQNQINKLLQKHHSIDIHALRQLHSELSSKIAHIAHDEETIQQLATETDSQHTELSQLAKRITHERNAVLPHFEVQINTLVEQLGMPYGKIMMQLTPLPSLNQWGADMITLLFAPNKGSIFQPLEEVGSGGEKSRLMLAIKSTTAASMNLPTLIFDEIDTGISGQVAIIVGELLKKIAHKHQIIAITHLPQVAAKGSKHLFVYKDHSGDISQTLIKDLDEEAKIENIASMLSGDVITDAARLQAKHLMEL